MGQSDADDLPRLARCGETLFESRKVLIVMADAGDNDVEDGAYLSPAAIDAPLALVFAAVVGQGGESSQLGDLLIFPRKSGRVKLPFVPCQPG